MARSPPLTATYMSTSLCGEPRGARDRDNGIVVHQHDIDTARKQRSVNRKPLEQIFWLDRGLQRSRAVDARTLQFENRTVRQTFDLQDQRRRTIGILVAAEGKTIERRKILRVSDQRKAADRGIGNDGRAGVEFEP